MINYPSEAMISKNIDSSTCYIFDNTFLLELPFIYMDLRKIWGRMAKNSYFLKFSRFRNAQLPIEIYWKSVGAGDGIRTHDIYLGKVTLYPWATPAFI